MPRSEFDHGCWVTVPKQRRTHSNYWILDIGHYCLITCMLQTPAMCVTLPTSVQTPISVAPPTPGKKCSLCRCHRPQGELPNNSLTFIAPHCVLLRCTSDRLGNLRTLYRVHVFHRLLQVFSLCNSELVIASCLTSWWDQAGRQCVFQYLPTSSLLRMAFEMRHCFNQPPSSFSFPNPSFNCNGSMPCFRQQMPWSPTLMS